MKKFFISASLLSLMFFSCKADNLIKEARDVANEIKTLAKKDGKFSSDCVASSNTSCKDYFIKIADEALSMSDTSLKKNMKDNGTGDVENWINDLKRDRDFLKNKNGIKTQDVENHK